MRPDDLEFLIAQYADRTLPSEQVAGVEAILRRDPRARQVLEEYRSVDAALAGVVGRQSVPEVQWDRLADRISRQVGALGTGSTITEEVEQQIAAVADGSLPAAEARLIEARLQADPQARLLLAEYGSLERLFEAARATPLPAVKWEALSRHLSRAVANEQAASAPESYKIFAGLHGVKQREPGVLARIGRWMSAPSRLAIAACLLIGATVTFRMIGGGPGGTTPVGPNANPAQVTPQPGGELATTTPPKINVRGPGDTLPPGIVTDRSAFANVEIGPPANGADPASIPGGFEDPGNRPSRASVASDKSGVQEKDAKAQRDTGWLPR
jgi:hypothetical protein